MAATSSLTENSSQLRPRDDRRTSGGRRLSWRSRVSGDEETMAVAASAAMAGLDLGPNINGVDKDEEYNGYNLNWGNSQKFKIPENPDEDSGEDSGKVSGKVSGKDFGIDSGEDSGYELSRKVPVSGGLRSRRKQSFVRTLSRVPPVSGINAHDWSSLSQDLLVMIFRQLAPRDRMESAMVCLTWHHASSIPKCWEEMDGLDWSKERVLTGFLNPVRQNLESGESGTQSRRVSARFSRELERESEGGMDGEEESEEGFSFQTPTRRNGEVKGTKRVQNLNIGFNGSQESRGKGGTKVNGNHKNGTKNGYGNGKAEASPLNPNVMNRNLNRHLTQSVSFNYNFDADLDKEMEMDLHPIAQEFLARFESVGDRFMRQAVQLSQGNLKKLRIGHCTFSGLATIAISCPFIEVLEVEEFLGNVNSFLMAVSGKCGYLKVLGIGLSRFVAMEDRVIEDEIVAAMINGCEDLVSVRFNGCSLSYSQAIMIAKGFPEMKSFEANLGGLWAHGEENESLDNVLGVLSERCLALQSLKLSSRQTAPPGSVTSLLHNCTALTTCELTVAGGVMDYWTRSLPPTSSSSLSSLSSLSLSGGSDDLLSFCSPLSLPPPSSSSSSSSSSIWRLTCLSLQCLRGDRLLVHVAARCHFLRTLHIKGARDVTDASLKTVFSVCPFLADVDVTGVAGLTDRTLEYLGESCPELESFSCFSEAALEIESVTFTVEGVERLINGCAKLEALHINLPIVKQRRRGSRTDVFIALPTILTIGNLGPSLKSLRLVAPNLSLSPSSSPSPSSHSSSPSHSRSSHSLSPSHSHSHSSLSLSLPSSRPLEYVDINSSLSVLSNYCENLSSIHLEGFKNILDWALESLVLTNRGLKRILIREGSVTNAGAFCVAHLCPFLEFLDFSGTRVTPEIMRKFEETSWPPKQVVLCC